MTHLDLFTGVGGFTLAAQWNGFRTVGFCEIEPYVQQTIKERFGAVLADATPVGCGWRSNNEREASTEGNRFAPCLHPDIFTLNGADYRGVTLVTGGFPCQPFSVAGKRRGKEDDRHLWPEMLRVIGEARPAWVLGENVPGIIQMELDRVLSDLESIGYACWPLVIPACAVDAKHRRERVWIVANAAGTQPYNAGKWDNPEGWETIRPGSCGETVAHARSGRRQGQGQPVNASDSTAQIERQATESFNGGKPHVWQPEPELGRVANGIPNRTHRLRGLGNAIVPQVAAEIIRLMVVAQPEVLP